MKIYIDISVLTLATFLTGIQRVTQEIILRLIDDNDFEICLMHYNAKKNQYFVIDNNKFTAYYREGKGVKNEMITKRTVPLSDIGEGAVFFEIDAVWMSRVRRSYLLPILKAQGARIVVHVYDVISVTHPQYCLQRGVYNFMDYIGAHLQYADEIIVNAEATVDELKKLTNRLNIELPACHVVPLGADFRAKKEIDISKVPTEVRSACEEKPYILMVGTIEPRKNHKLLLEAYDYALKEAGYNIIFAGYMGWNMEAFEEKLISHPDYGRGVYHFSGLNDDGIDYLYQHAKFLAFCSYTEGYGLPIIEAIVRGTPVIAADIPVSKEVGGDYCQWFEQDDARDLCKNILIYLDNTEEYKKMKNSLKSFDIVSWQESYEGMKKVLS